MFLVVMIEVFEQLKITLKKLENYFLFLRFGYDKMNYLYKNC